MVAIARSRPPRFFTAALMTVILPVANAFAVPTEDSFQPQVQPSVTVTQAASDVDVNGALDDPAWKSAARFGNFAEVQPGDNIRPEVRTDVLVTYDADKLYVAFICYDDHPGQLRATMSQRDRYSGDDMVGVCLDTYNNTSWAYEFMVNPYGVQKDMLWTSITGEDSGYDLIWESAARITDSGYTVEIAIPFASMRFPNKDEQNWRVQFLRNRPRGTTQQYAWAAVNRNERCRSCQWGTLEGIRNVRPGKGIEILPAFVATQAGHLTETAGPAYDFDNGKPKGEMSIGGKYAVTSDITMEAALNPDFSQIEADADQIDVNSTISLMYPERRPFFQEGSDIFATLFNSFYTRTINDPSLAAKITGRTGRTTIGAVVARDDNTPYMIPLDASSVLLNTGKSTSTILRASQQFGANSRLGFMLTDRRFDGGGSGTVFSLDGDLRLSPQYHVVGQALFTHTLEPDKPSLTPGYGDLTFDRGRHTIGLDGEGYSGHAFIVRFDRDARSLNYFLGYNQIEPSYRTQNGYDPVNNHRTGEAYAGYTFYFTGGPLVTITPNVYGYRRWDFITGVKRQDQINASLNVDTRVAGTSFSTGYTNAYQLWQGVGFEDMWHVYFDIDGRPNKGLGYGFYWEYGRGLSYYNMAKGKEASFSAYLSLKPIDRLTVEPTFNFTRMTGLDYNERYYNGYITRTRVQYQATRELSFRLVVQYNDFNRAWDVDPLLTYRLGSFSVFYVGSTYDYNELDRLPSDPHHPTQWQLTERQFFMKLQYLFRT